MQYEWECQVCHHIAVVNHKVADRNTPPSMSEGYHPSKDGTVHDIRWKRILSMPSVPFVHLRQSGVLADDNGNFAPRKI